MSPPPPSLCQSPWAGAAGAPVLGRWPFWGGLPGTLLSSHLPLLSPPAGAVQSDAVVYVPRVCAPCRCRMWALSGSDPQTQAAHKALVQGPGRPRGREEAPLPLRSACRSGDTGKHSTVMLMDCSHAHPRVSRQCHSRLGQPLGWKDPLTRPAEGQRPLDGQTGLGPCRDAVEGSEGHGKAGKTPDFVGSLWSWGTQRWGPWF